MLEPITSYVAIGDSFSEGLMDPDPRVEDRYRGWTDRLALMLTESAVGSPDLSYANLAIRGRLLDRIVDDQVPQVLEMKPDLVSLCAGGNDCLRPKADIDALAAKFERAVIAMREAGIEVLMCNGFDTEFSTPLIRAVRPRVGIYNAHLWSIAQRHGCHMVDLWGLRSLYAAQMWADDRIHLSTKGHHLVAEQALATLESGRSLPVKGFGVPARPTRAIREVMSEESRWAREYLAPWVGRRLRGQSSGDTLDPKLPELTRVRDLVERSREVDRAQKNDAAGRSGGADLTDSGGTRPDETGTGGVHAARDSDR
ncbi:MAG: SGNH/GDSL hydrolase family protein [Brevibacterium linens]